MLGAIFRDWGFQGNSPRLEKLRKLEVFVFPWPHVLVFRLCVSPSLLVVSREQIISTSISTLQSRAVILTNSFNNETSLPTHLRPANRLIWGRPAIPYPAWPFLSCKSLLSWVPWTLTGFLWIPSHFVATLLRIIQRHIIITILQSSILAVQTLLMKLTLPTHGLNDYNRWMIPSLDVQPTPNLHTCRAVFLEVQWSSRPQVQCCFTGIDFSPSFLLLALSKVYPPSSWWDSYLSTCLEVASFLLLFHLPSLIHCHALWNLSAKCFLHRTWSRP